jgi:hypothetical protein
MSQPFIPQEILQLDKTQFTHRDGYNCVSKRPNMIETLFEPSSMYYRKMTTYPIHLYKDAGDSYYCFSNESLQLLQNSQSAHRKKTPVEIRLIKSFTEDECKREGQYHTESLEIINPGVRKIMKNIYQEEKEPVFFNIYVQSYNFLENRVFNLDDVADLLLIYYNNNVIDYTGDNIENQLLLDAIKRVNYKYACLTRAKKDGQKDLKIDIGHEYKLRMLFLLGDLYENIQEDLRRFYVGGMNTIKRYLEIISKLKNIKRNIFSQEDIPVLQNLQEIVELFESGFDKEYNDVNVQEVIDTLRPVIVMESSEEEKSDLVDRKEKEVDKKPLSRQKSRGKKKGKKDLQKEQKEEKKEDLGEQNSIDANIQDEVIKYFRSRFANTNQIFKYFDNLCLTYVKKFPFSFSVCINYIEHDIYGLEFNEFYKTMIDSESQFNTNVYVNNHLKNIYRFFLENYNKNNVLCTLIECDPTRLTSVIQVQRNIKNVDENIASHTEKIKTLEKFCREYKDDIYNAYKIFITDESSDLGKTEEGDRLLANIKYILHNMFEQYLLTKDNEFIVFPYTDSDKKEEKKEDKKRKKEKKDKEELNWLEKLNLFGNEINKKMSSTISLLTSAIALKEKTLNHKKLLNPDKDKKLIEAFQKKIIEIDGNITLNKKDYIQDIVLFFSSKLMKLHYYKYIIWLNKNKKQLLNDLKNILEKYDMLKQKQTPDCKNAVLYALLQEDLQCANVEISALLTQSFNTSPFTKALYYQQAIKDKFFGNEFMLYTDAEKININIDNFQKEVFVNDFFQWYQRNINDNISLQAKLAPLLRTTFYKMNQQEVNVKINQYETMLLNTRGELQEVVNHKKDLIRFFYKEFDNDNDFIEQLLEQSPKMTTKVSEIFELTYYYFLQSREFYYFYNDEFYNREQEILQINKDKLKSLFSKIKQSGILNSQIINEIMLLVYCIFSSLFISINYLENKIRVMNTIPPIVMTASQNSQIYEIKSWTNKIKTWYIDLILSNYKLQ